MKRRSEGRQGERKWDIEKWTKITLFQGENSVFVNRQTKKTKRKERLRANCPKTHVQGCVDPSWRRKCRKEQNTKRREGICKRSRYKFTKTRSTKEDKRTPENFGKSIRAAAASRFLAAAQIEPKPRRRCKNENAPKTSQIGPRPGKMGKTSFSKSPRFCSPRPFFAFQNQFGQKFELPKKQICETPKKLRQKWTATWRRYDGSNAMQPGPATQNCSETPCFQAFRVPLPLGLRLEEPRPETHAKNENLFGPQKTTSTTSKMAFLKNPKNPKTVRIFGFRTPQKNPFRAIKTVVSKGGGRKLTHGGPQINPRNPFWGAAN